MFKRILVPLDGSTNAERAIAHAEYFARIFNGKIILLRVLEPDRSGENSVSVDPLNWQIRKAEADMYLHEVAARVRERLAESQHGGKDEKIDNRVEHAIREGRAAENIVNFAHSQDIDLVVLTTHGASGLSRWSISSVTQKVIERIYLPVLLIRAYQQLSSDEDELGYRKILLPIDSSRRAECVLSAGISLARGVVPEEGTGGRPLQPVTAAHSAQASPASQLILATVITPIRLPIPEPYSEEVQQLHDHLIDASRAAANGYLKELKERIGAGCEMHLVEKDNVTTAIQELAEEVDADLVLMSAHGYGGQFTQPYGSVTRNYIEQGTRPTLIIQDVPGSLVPRSAAEIAAEKFGGR